MSDFKVVKLLGAPVEINFPGNINYTGAYSNVTAYATGDAVSYLGSSYVALGATTGNIPTNTSFWQLLAEKGDTGATGPAGPTGTSTFTALTDVPSSYVGQSLKTVRVNAGATGLEFTTAVDTDEKVKVSSNDTTAKYLEDAITVSHGTNASTVLAKTTLNDGGDEDVQIQFDVSKVDLSLANNTTSNFASKAYADAKVADSITDGVTTIAPSQNAVFDALALKRDITSIVPIVYGGTGASTEPVARANLGISMTSLYSGGVVSGLGTATFSVTAGLGYIVSQTLAQLEPTSVAVNFSSVTSVSPLYTRGVIYVNSAGTILQVDVGGTPLTQLFKKQNIILASYVVSGGIIISLPSLPSTPIGAPSKLEDLMEALGPLNLSGNIYSANGANLFLNKSAGETFQLKSNIVNSLEVRDITTDVASSPISNAATAYAYRNVTGGFTLAPYTGVSPNLWDDGSGTPAAVTGGSFTIQRIYYFNRSNSTIIYLGQTEYTTLAAADAAVGTEIRVVDSGTTFGTFRSSLVIKHNTTDLTDSSKAVFFEASKFGASGAGSSSGTTTLQGAYDNSITPEITTNATLGGLTVKRGSAADTDNIIEGKNGAGTTTFAVDGNGKTTTASLVIGSISGVLKSTSGTVSAATAGTDYENPLTFSAPLSRSVNAISIPAATTSVSGHLTSTDWTTFNNKVPTSRNISTTSPLVGGGDLSADRTLSIPAATTSVAGHLTSTDWNIFNNKIGNSFETVSKNLREFPYTLTYTLGVLTSITYTVPSGTIVKTLNYTLGVLTSVVLSGTLPSGILTTKTLTYTLGVLTSVAYS
jgi:hypothetical protein